MNFRKYFPLIRTLKLEPFVFMFMVAMVVKMVTVIQLYQDKVCVNELRYGPEFCKNLKSNDTDSISKKSNVLGHAAVYQMYQSLISTVPIAGASLFVGCWIDKYHNSIKILLLVSSIGGALETLLLTLNALNFEWRTSLILVSYIPSAFSGSYVYILMAAFSYIPKTTVEQWRSIRYAVMELAFFFGYPLGQFLGGVLVATKPIGEHAIHNYISVFIVSIALYVLCIIWVIFVFRDTKSTEFLIVNEENNEIGNGNRKNDPEVLDQKWYSFFKNIFVWENARETVRACFKKRNNHGRLQMWLLIMSLYVVCIQVYGGVAISFPFTERVFGWTSFVFSTVNSVNTVLSNIIMMVFVYLLVKKFKVKDIRLAVIGCTSYLLQIMIRGSLLNGIAFVVSYLVGSLGSLSSIGIRSYISRLVSKDELGKVFCVIAALESTIEIISGVLFSLIFKMTVKDAPYLIFLILAVAMFYPLIAVIVVELKFDTKHDTQITEKTKETDPELPINESTERVHSEVLSTMK